MPHNSKELTRQEILDLYTAADHFIRHAFGSPIKSVDNAVGILLARKLIDRVIPTQNTNPDEKTLTVLDVNSAQILVGGLGTDHTIMSALKSHPLALAELVEMDKIIKKLAGKSEKSRALITFLHTLKRAINSHKDYKPKSKKIAKETVPVVIVAPKVEAPVPAPLPVVVPPVANQPDQAAVKEQALYEQAIKDLLALVDAYETHLIKSSLSGKEEKLDVVGKLRDALTSGRVEAKPIAKTAAAKVMLFNECLSSSVTKQVLGHHRRWFSKLCNAILEMVCGRAIHSKGQEFMNDANKATLHPPASVKATLTAR